MVLPANSVPSAPAAIPAAVLALLTLLPCLLAQSDDPKLWYSFPHSPDAAASAVATLELHRLPPQKRTIQAAIRLCQKQRQDIFCAWIAVDDLAGGRPLAVSCFNELHRQCNRREKVLVDGASPSKFRESSCENCSPCAYGQWDACPSCPRVCYCTCDKSGSQSDDKASIYRCNQFCDRQKECSNGQDEGNDCNLYKLGGSSPPRDALLAHAQRFATSLVLLAIPVAFLCASHLWNYTRYRAVLRRSQSMAPAPVPAPPPDSYPHQ